jgi:hypothetical protein
MSDEISLGTVTPLPDPPAGWVDHGYAALSNGSLALIRTDRDIRAEHRLWRSRVSGEDVHAQPPDLRDFRLRLSRFDGDTEIGAVEVPAAGWPKADSLTDGRWLVVSTRAAPGEQNGRLFAADGTPAGSLAMGDGINHVRCAPDGTTWVGYFDEGIFESCQISASGIARFDPDGCVLWGFNSEARASLSIADCYALTLDGNALWCCSYTDFPIVRVLDGVIDHWTNDIAGASALAVDGDHVLLAGGYDQSDQVALLRLTGDRAQQIGVWRLRMPDRTGAHLLQGQGATLHIVGQGRWTRLSVSTLRLRTGSPPA